MWVGKLDPWFMVSFLHGFESGLNIAGLPEVEQVRWTDKALRRGWKVRSTGPIGEMRERGMSEREIITELIEIEIDALREIQKSL